MEFRSLSFIAIIIVVIETMTVAVAVSATVSLYPATTTATAAARKRQRRNCSLAFVAWNDDDSRRYNNHHWNDSRRRYRRTTLATTITTAATTSAFSSSQLEEDLHPQNGESLWKRKTSNFSVSPLRQKFESAGGVLYKQGVLSTDEYGALKKELHSLSLRMTDEGGASKNSKGSKNNASNSSFAKNRTGSQLPVGALEMLTDENGSLCRLVRTIAGGEEGGRMVLAPDIPMEVSR